MHYQLPPDELADLVNLTPDPLLLFGPHEHWLLVADRDSFPPIELLRQRELKLAGVRINPDAFTPHAISGFSNPRLRNIETGQERPITGFPDNVQMRNLRWSPKGDRIACCVLTSTGLQLWLIDYATAQAQAITPPDLNNSLGGSPYDFFGNDRIIVKRRLPELGDPPTEPHAGPVVQDTSGQEAANRTYTNLLQSPYDEALFRYYGMVQLYAINLDTLNVLPWAAPGIITGVTDAPNLEYFLVTYIDEPFSYRVPYQKFADRLVIVDAQGSLVRTLAERPVSDNLAPAIGAVVKEARRFTWRSDHPAQLYWVEALDGGDPRVEVENREQLYYLEAPFAGEPVKSIQLPMRFGALSWCRGDLALVIDWRWKDRKQVIRRWYPDQPERGTEVIFDLNWEDKYNDPGSFMSTTLPNDHTILLTRNEGKTLVLSGSGHSDAGQRPYLAEYDLESGDIRRVWESQDPYFESVAMFRDEFPDWFVVSRETTKERPNFFLRHFVTGEEKQLTNFDHPYPKLRDANFEILKYEREDGVKLSGELHTPAGFTPGVDAPLPVLMWAYPREYKDAEAAGQTLVSPNQFTHISPMGPLAWIARGFAVLDDFAMPIIGEGDQEPNETFIEQVQLNAQAAVQTLIEKGVADPQRIYVGGHSYGAFMTAHLLAHTDLFAGGIARSGAYNRTLTPFGFQSEERTFWQTPEVYMQLSPFLHADKIDAPLLLIHGKDDSNSGTYPMQSRRFFEALNGLGKTARLVILPHEDHGYSAKESILHMLYEMDRWME